MSTRAEVLSPVRWSGPSRSVLLVTAALLIGVVILTATIFVAAATGMPFGMFSRDLTVLRAEAASSLPPYAGCLALFNMMTWASIASLACLVATLVPLRRRWLLSF